MGLGGIYSAPQASREALCHMQIFSPDFTPLLPPFHIPSCPFSRKSRTLSMNKPSCAPAPLFPRGHHASTSPGCPITAPSLGGPGGLQWAIPRANSCTGVGECLSCPGAPSRRGPGLARGVPEAPPRSQQREPKGREWWTPGSTRGCHLSPLRAVCKCSGTSLHSRTPCREIPCLSLREPSLSRDCSQSSPPACAGDLGPDTLENSGCGSKEGVPKSLTSGFPPVQIITRHHVQTQHTVKHLCSDHFMGDVVCLN